MVPLLLVLISTSGEECGKNDGFQCDKTSLRMTEAWTISDIQGGFVSTAALSKDNSTLFIGGLNKKFYAVDVATGSIKWVVDVDGKIASSAAVSIEYVIFGCSDTNIRALRQTDGTQVWTLKLDKGVDSSPLLDENNNTLYVGGVDNFLYSIKLEDGTINWKFETNGRLSETVLDSRGNLYFSSSGKKIYCVSSLGVEIWSYTANDRPSPPSIAADGSVLYAGTLGGSLLAINTSNGLLIWQFEIKGGIAARPLVHNTSLYFGSLGFEIFKISSEGQPLWSFSEASGQFYAMASIWNEYLLIGCLDKSIYALDTQGGNVISSFPTDQAIAGRVTLSSDKGMEDTKGARFFVGTFDSSGSLFAVDLEIS
eukprot:UC4_evm8s379